jgi:hypothetical protein
MAREYLPLEYFTSIRLFVRSRRSGAVLPVWKKRLDAKTLVTK